MVKELDLERFPHKKENWVQIEVICNGDYVINRLQGHDNPNLVFDLTIHCSELELVAPAEMKSYEVFADDYGLNPMRWFSYHDGYYKIKIPYGLDQCQDCLDADCLMKNDKEKVIERVCLDIDDKFKNNTNKEKRFEAYKEIVNKKHGKLGFGIRRKLGICCEIYVRNQFPAEDEDQYGEFHRR